MADLIDKLADDEREAARKTSMPDWREPMLAKLTHDYFSDDEWIYERKLDGERVIAYVGVRGGVTLMSRNKKALNDNYPEIEEAVKEAAPRGCILDGEVVAFDKDNISDFQRLQGRMQASSRKQARQSRVKVYYYIFDCLYLDGHDIAKCSLVARKKLLKAAVDWHAPLYRLPHRNGDGLEYYKEACRKGWEGVIAKKAHSRYTHGRSSHWLKFKCVRQQEFVVGGFTEPRGKRQGLGALLLGFYRNGKLVYAGQVGTGFDNQMLQKLRDRLNRIERKNSPYDEGQPEKKGVHFVTPKLVCEVAFTEWTKDDKLRHPRYKGLRDDKSPKRVHKEEQAQSADL